VKKSRLRDRQRLRKSLVGIRGNGRGKSASPDYAARLKEPSRLPVGPIHSTLQKASKTKKGVRKGSSDTQNRSPARRRKEAEHGR